uniref:Uncharacterized protein n=1 Tax=Micrurus surinamensis TaxID=129470 RepID=A0A2D4NMB2_MICSU
MEDKVARMIQQSANLLCYNELVNYMEALCIQKIEVDQQIEKLLTSKAKVQNEIDMLKEQLENIRESLVWKNAVQNEIDNILSEGLLTYDKIMDSSKMLLNVLETEIKNVDKMIELQKQYYESP